MSHNRPAFAVDMDDPQAIVSPGGVGFDINCGVRLIRTNLTEADVAPVKEQLAQALFDHIPVGVGSKVSGADACDHEGPVSATALRSTTSVHWLPSLPPLPAAAAACCCRASFPRPELTSKRPLRWA
jgi:hypothetical protein